MLPVNISLYLARLQCKTVQISEDTRDVCVCISPWNAQKGVSWSLRKVWINVVNIFPSCTVCYKSILETVLQVSMVMDTSYWKYMYKYKPFELIFCSVIGSLIFRLLSIIGSACSYSWGMDLAQFLHAAAAEPDPGGYITFISLFQKGLQAPSFLYCNLH